MRYQKYIMALLLALVTFGSFSQTGLLKKYDFDKGGYYLIGITSKADPNALADSLGDFYTDDIKVLNAIKKEWVFKKPSPQYACGYHYNIAICKDGLELESLAINLNCNEIVSDAGYFYFDSEKLSMFKNSFKKPYRKENRFSAVAEARAFWESTLKDNKLILAYTPDWAKYEGTFRFTYQCEKGKDCFDNEKSVLQKVTKEIKSNYPGESFELDVRGSSRENLSIEVSSNKSLETKFKLYKRDLKYDNWRDYALRLYTFWTENKN